MLLAVWFKLRLLCAVFKQFTYKINIFSIELWKKPFLSLIVCEYLKFLCTRVQYMLFEWNTVQRTDSSGTAQNKHRNNKIILFTCTLNVITVLLGSFINMWGLKSTTCCNTGQSYSVEIRYCSLHVKPLQKSLEFIHAVTLWYGKLIKLISKVNVLWTNSSK